jgi:hypothetical protein
MNGSEQHELPHNNNENKIIDRFFMRNEPCTLLVFEVYVKDLRIVHTMHLAPCSLFSLVFLLAAKLQTTQNLHLRHIFSKERERERQQNVME